MTCLRSLAAIALASTPLLAQVALSGNVYDGAGGPLQTGVVYHAIGSITLPAGKTLTAQAGAIVKFDGALFAIDGTLLTNGTASSPVIFTSIHDDAAGGDTNGNGNSTTPGPNQWYGISFTDGSDASSLKFTTVRYTGYSYHPLLNLQTANITATDCTFSAGGWGGIAMDAKSLPTLTRCTVTNVQNRPAIYGVQLDAVPGFTDCVLTGSTGGNFIRIDSTSLTADRSFQANNCAGGALVYATSLAIPAGRTLTLGPGVVMKAASGLLVQVPGMLRTNGTSTNPVYLTSIYDDAVGGDTNGDGNATLPGPNQWYGIEFTSGASVLAFTTVRNTGYAYYPALNLSNANITATDCTFSDGGWGGMNLNGNSTPSIARCTFARIQNRPAVYGAPWEALPGLVDNSVDANSGGNYIRIENASFVGTVTVDARNCLGGALVCATSPTVAVNTMLNLRTGVVLKFSGTLFSIEGSLNVDGPVVFTSITDDAYGGDTNGDGPSSGFSNQWYGLRFLSTTMTSSVRRALIRYSGHSYQPGVYCNSALAAFHGTRVEYGGWGGFDLLGAAFADDLIAYANGSFGIRLAAGNFHVRNATVVNNSGYGVHKNGPWTGKVQSTVSFGNSNPGFVGFAADDINYSDGSGFVGGNGNSNVDPQLENAALGDLRLRTGSPCIDAGDPLEAPYGLDALGVPRFLDGNLDLVQRVDMGANEFDNILFGVFGEQKPGKTLNFVVVGSPAINLVAMVFGVPTPTGVPLSLPKWGSLYVDLFQPVVAISWPAPPSNVPITIPVAIGVPANLMVQAVGLVGTTGIGNVSNPGPLSIR